MNMTMMKTIIKIMKIKDKEITTTIVMCYVLRVSMKGWMRIIIMSIIKTLRIIITLMWTLAVATFSMWAIWKRVSIGSTIITAIQIAKDNKMLTPIDNNLINTPTHYNPQNPNTQSAAHKCHNKTV